MRPRVAILLDGAFVTRVIAARLGRFPGAPDILDLVTRTLAHPRLTHAELFRAYFYDAPPLVDSVRHPMTGVAYEFRRQRVYEDNHRLQHGLITTPDLAVRFGEAVCRGWRLRTHALTELVRLQRPLQPSDLGPEVEQKGVDLRVGLDVASLAFKRVVQEIVIVSADSDLVPAMKFARREGLRVHLETLGHGVRRAMLEHADVVL